MLHASGLGHTPEELLRTTVCDLDSENCNFGRCGDCPGTTYVETLLRGLDVFRSDNSEVRVQQWIAGIRCTLQCFVMTPQEFSENFLSMLSELKVHHFISKQQAQHLRALKANLSKKEAVAVMDFAENYSFVIQDAPQSYHWVNTQATIHPIVVYCASENNEVPPVMSFAVISDCLEHDTAAVSAFQHELMKYLKKDLPELKEIHYFSDGASSQYKNKKKFLNLCHHESDYQIQADWNFFATSHGKSACDGIGGTVKRLAGRASLQRPFQDQIQTPEDLFSWARENIKGVRVIWVPKAAVTERRAHLASRFSTAKAIKGTRSLHYFKPISLSTMLVSVTSSSERKEVKVTKRN